MSLPIPHRERPGLILIPNRDGLARLARDHALCYVVRISFILDFSILRLYLGLRTISRHRRIVLRVRRSEHQV